MSRQMHTSPNRSTSETIRPNIVECVPKPPNMGVRDLPLRDMISLGAWRMGLGCSGKILPSSPPPSPPPPSPIRIWKMTTSRVLLRNRSFRSARIDPSRRAIAEGYMYVKRIRKKNQISKKSWKKTNNGRKQA